MEEKSCRNCINAEIVGTKKLVYCEGGDRRLIEAPVKEAAKCKAYNGGKRPTRRSVFALPTLCETCKYVGTDSDDVLICRMPGSDDSTLAAGLLTECEDYCNDCPQDNQN